MTMIQKHLVEDEDSFELHVQRQEQASNNNNKVTNKSTSSDKGAPHQVRRALKHHHKGHAVTKEDLASLEREKEAEYWKQYQAKVAAQEEQLQHASEERESRIHELYQSSGIVKHKKTTHGMIIDAGSTGSQLIPALAEYLEPLLDFAKAVLHSKQEEWGEFPIFLRATAGMRILPTDSRARVMDAVRRLFAHNATFSPFAFAPEQARVLSGEEEAIYDWAGVNFLMGNLISQSEGAGTVARLVADKSPQERLVDGVYDPCMPGGAKTDIRSNIHLTNHTRMESWNQTEVPPTTPSNGFYEATLRNDHAGGDPDHCFQLAKDLLHLEQNQWCQFAHQGDCSLAGVYQPKLPRSESFGEFVAFSNYHHVWKFLKLPDVSSIAELEAATRHVCAMGHAEVRDWANSKKFPDSEIDSYCFRSAYVFQLLHNGFGFRMNDTIRATNVINGHKVGWALGAMLYEINALPWRYRHDAAAAPSVPIGITADSAHVKHGALSAIFMGLLFFLFGIFIVRRRRNALYSSYEPIKETTVNV
eukprot:scaffold2576_cov175-Amphora_coffeaeformis.AAC.18